MPPTFPHVIFLGIPAKAKIGKIDFSFLEKVRIEFFDDFSKKILPALVASLGLGEFQYLFRFPDPGGDQPLTYPKPAENKPLALEIYFRAALFNFLADRSI